tara:strand:- start:384 stop:563 length:180 start_codon:yes stop_codon:yes gene_type:complete
MAQKKGKKAGCPMGQIYDQKLKKCVSKKETSYEKKQSRRILRKEQAQGSTMEVHPIPPK